MKYLFTLSVCLFMCGCSFVYNSKGSNIIDLKNPKYKDIVADGVKLGGRCIEVTVFHKGGYCK